jgi:U4/U6 small nuclear ribonucleoprotein PRP4
MNRNIYFGSLEDKVQMELNKETTTNPNPNNDSKPLPPPVPPPNFTENEEFNRRSLAKTLKIPTEDSAVRSLLISINQPITCFGEGPSERRDRLRLMASRALTSLPRALQLFPTLASLLSGEGGQGNDNNNINIQDSDSDSDNEEFYVPGSVDLVRIRSIILKDSITRAQQASSTLNHIQEQSLRKELHDQLKQSLQLTKSFMDPQGRPLSACTFSDDSKLFTADWSGRVMQYTEESSALFANLSERITALTSHFNFLAIGTATGKISIFDTGNGNGNDNFDGVNGNDNFDGVNDDNIPTTINTNNNIPITINTNNNIPATTPSIDSPVKSLNFHPSHQFIASASGDSLWRLWDVNRLAQPLQVQEGHVKGISSGTWHPHGALYCTGGTQDGIIRVWDCRLGKAIWSILSSSSASSAISSLAFAPLTPNVLASANSDGLVSLHDLRKLETDFAKVAAHRSACSQIKFAHQGRVIVSSGFDGNVRLWAPGDLRLIKDLVFAPNSKISSIDTTESCPFKIAAVSLDRSVKIYSNQ